MSELKTILPSLIRHILPGVLFLLPFDLQTAGIWEKVFLFILSILILRLFFVSPSSAMTVILPMASAYGTSMGLPVLQIMLLTTLLIASVVILPIYSPTMYLAYQSGYFTRRDQWVIGSVLILSTLLSALLSMLFLWKT